MSEKTLKTKPHRRLPGQTKLEAGFRSELEERRAQMRLQSARRAALNLPDNLKNLRLRMDLTQAEMARHLSISQRALQLYESGLRSVSSEILERLYVLFGIDLHEMFVGGETPLENRRVNEREENAALRRAVTMMGLDPSKLAAFVTDPAEEITSELVLRHVDLNVDALVKQTGMNIPIGEAGGWKKYWENLSLETSDGESEGDEDAP